MSNAFSRTKSTAPVTRRLPTLTGEQRGVLDSLSNMVRGNIGIGANPFPGTVTPGASTLQAKAFGAVDSYGRDPAAIARASAIDDGLSGRPAWQTIADDPYVDEYMSAVSAPTMRMFQRDIVPQILEAYGAGGPSGAVYSALGDASADLAGNLGAMRADFVNQALQRAEANRITGIGLSEREQLMPIQLAGMFGDVQRGIEGEQRAEQLGRWESIQPYNNPALGFLGTVLGTKAFDTWYRPSSKREEPTILASVMKGLSNPLGGLLGGSK